MIISTGLANEDEIAEAVEAAEGCPLVLLHCVSSYPAPCEDMNLATISHMAQKYGVPTGLSDHSTGISVPITATALGAVVIEKHMTLCRADGGVDSDFSLEADEFADMVKACKKAYSAVGQVDYSVKESEAGGREARRSLYVTCNVSEGEIFTENNIRSIRPGFGLHPKHYDIVIGSSAVKDIDRGTPLNWDMVSGE